MPNKIETIRLINNDANTNVASKTWSGVNAFTGANTHSGVETHSGAETHSGVETHSGAEVFSGTPEFTGVPGLIDTNFNPALRVYRRQQMGQAIKSAAQRNDWSVYTSVKSCNLDWIVAGSGAGASTGYHTSADSDGGCILSHTATSSSFMWIKPADGGIFDTVKWGTSKNPRMRVVMQTGSNITGSQFVCGLYSAATSPNRFDGTAKAIRAEVVFNQVVAASWKVDVAGTGSSSVSGDTSTAVAVSTVYDIDIRVQSDRTVVVYINGVLVYTSVKVLTATKNLIPMIGLQNRTTFHRPVKIYHVELSQDIAA